MKVFFDKSDIASLDKFTDEELRECGTYNREAAAKPIVLENFVFGINSKGQYCLRFESPNHKYLKINYSAITTERPSEDGKKFFSRILELETYEKHPFKDEETGEKMFESSNVHLQIFLEPDTEEEENMLRGCITTLALKYEYCVTIVPYSDMEDISEEIITIEKPEEEFIYE